MSAVITAARPQIQSADATDPERLRRVLNDILIGLYQRIEALEAARGVTALPQVSFDTGAAIALGTAPFDGGTRIACPFTPTGLVLLLLQQTTSAAPLTSATDVKWHYAAGQGPGDGAVIIDFVTGLAVNTSYVLRVGVTRG